MEARWRVAREEDRLVLRPDSGATLVLRRR